MQIDNAKNPLLLALDEEEASTRLTTAFTLIERQRHVVASAASEYFCAWRRQLQDWRMPPAAHLIAAAHYLLSQGLIDERAPTYPFTESIIEAVRSLDAVITAFTSRDDGHDTIRYTQRTLRLGQLFIRAYHSLDLVLIGLAHCTVRLRMIGVLPEHEAQWLAEECEAIYLPLVEMLGMWQFRREFGDIILRTIDAHMYDKIVRQQLAQEAVQKSMFDRISSLITPSLDAISINAPVSLHRSAVSSIVRRARRGEDLTAFIRLIKVQVLPQTEDECYRVLGAIHRNFPPIAGRTPLDYNFRELIASPKYNGYRGLITTSVLQDSGGVDTMVQFRIFTPEMKRTNDYGVIGAKRLGPMPTIIKNAWWDSADLVQFVQSQPVGSSTSRIYVFSPVGEIYRLPQKSTPIDYAYRVHSEIGNHCKRVWVNGRSTSYDAQLLNGDLLEIEVDHSYLGPLERWLTVVQTVSAKMNIKRAISHRRILPPAGREIIEKILAHETNLYGLQEIPAEIVDQFLEKTARKFHYADASAMYVDIADPHKSSRLKPPSPTKIVGMLIQSCIVDYILVPRIAMRSGSRPRIRLAQCEHDKRPCRVIPGTPIVGRFIYESSPSEALVVYRQDCPNAPRGKQAIPLSWRFEHRPGEAMRINIKAVDRFMLLDGILKAIYQFHSSGLYLLSVQAIVDRDYAARITMTVEAANHHPIELLADYLASLRTEGVIDEVQINSLSPMERLRLVEIDTLPNPYTATSVRDRRVFKGRDQEIKRLMTCLKGAQNLIVLYGINRIGKTSLMHYIHDQVARQERFVPVMLDIQGLGKHEEESFWQELASQLAKVIEHYIKNRRLIDRRGMAGYERFCALLQEMERGLGGDRLLLMVDEFSLLDELWDVHSAMRVIYKLKSLIEGHPEIAFILCIQETLYKAANLPGNSHKVVSWPLLRIGVPLRLDYLDRSAAEKLIREPMGQLLRYSDKVVEYIVWLTSGHPFYLQNILFSLVDQLRVRGGANLVNEVQLNDLLEVAEELLDNGQYLFFNYIQELSGLKKIVLTYLAQGTDSSLYWVDIHKIQDKLVQHGLEISSSTLVLVLDELLEAGIVESQFKDGSPAFCIRVPLFAWWVRRYHSCSTNIVEHR